MTPTPVHSTFNEDLLAMMPRVKRLVEVGCSNGNLGQAYLRGNPGCDYIGVESSEVYADMARKVLPRVLVGDIETFTVKQFRALGQVDCWVFGDVLEHLVEPWSVLQRIHEVSKPGDMVLACIPNMQNWEVQLKLLTGRLYLTQTGLLDKTHLRWFTKQTFVNMLDKTGWEVMNGKARHFQQDGEEFYIKHLKEFLVNLGISGIEDALDCAIAYQYVVLSTFKE